MEDVNLILEAVKFMVLGMTVVFAFLALLVVVVNLQAKLIAKFFPEETKTTQVSPNNTDEAHHVAVIVAAVTEFRKQS